jgi:hypothetical protein
MAARALGSASVGEGNRWCGLFSTRRKRTAWWTIGADAGRRGRWLLLGVGVLQRFARPNRGCGSYSVSLSLSLANIPAAFLLLPFRAVYLPLPRLSQSPRFAFGGRNAKEFVVVQSRYGEGPGFWVEEKQNRWECKQTGVIEADRGRGGVENQMALQIVVRIQCHSRPGIPGVVCMAVVERVKYARRGSVNLVWCSWFRIHGFLRLTLTPRLESVCRGFSQLRSRWA